MPQITDNTALIIIDVQDAFKDPNYVRGNRNNPNAEDNMARLLAEWRSNNRPIFHVKHNSTEPHSLLRPELPGNAIQAVVAPQGDEPVIEKNVNSAFIGTDLEDRLRQAGIETVVIVGLTTEHCISTSVRMAGNLGFHTYLVDDATATYDGIGIDGTHIPAATVHAVELASLHNEFATVVKTEQLIG